MDHTHIRVTYERNERNARSRTTNAAPGNGFRRAGLEFVHREPREFELASLTLDQVAALESDPMLVAVRFTPEAP